ncbi:5-demethoxyubiquinone hydroxylase, mitochondrial [Smittium culicis]|uniref:5-demethoxyubiquinone hydroxylase, mitochondrial n=1 Tax=Smittium culicis TaxID=133412 RepID=A0A1R1Y8S3_9FUNG|nr:5-demethoxyubiquinone hydroxylase, mitochondrial [Smittium culicis]
MKVQEQAHLDSFDKKVSQFNARPTILQPISAIGGFALGMVTAMLGPKAAMACTEAVETSIGNHYNNQLRELYNLQNRISETNMQVDTEYDFSNPLQPLQPSGNDTTSTSPDPSAVESIVPEINTLMEDIKLFRDQELEHLDAAVDNGAHQSILYNTISSTIKTGCKLAIFACEKI